MNDPILIEILLRHRDLPRYGGSGRSVDHHVEKGAIFKPYLTYSVVLKAVGGNRFFPDDPDAYDAASETANKTRVTMMLLIRSS